MTEPAALALHLARMAVGRVLFVLAMPCPVRWWATRGGWLRWALPMMGYYAHHVGQWWQRPMRCGEVRRSA
jgi:hypothetical protein